MGTKNIFVVVRGSSQLSRCELLRKRGLYWTRKYHVSVHSDSFGDYGFDCQIQWGRRNGNGLIWQTVYSMEHSVSSKAISCSASKIPHVL